MDYKNAKKKAEELVSKMTVDEKMSQLLFDSPAIERLGINEYNWWNKFFSRNNRVSKGNKRNRS